MESHSPSSCTLDVSQVSVLHVSGNWPGKSSRCFFLLFIYFYFFFCPSHTRSFHDPSGPFQMITTLVVLYAAKMSKTVQFQDFDRSIPLKVSISVFKKIPTVSHFYLIVFYLPKYRMPLFSCQIFPLPLLYVGNHITGLASTKKLRYT